MVICGTQALIQLRCKPIQSAPLAFHFCAICPLRSKEFYFKEGKAPYNPVVFIFHLRFVPQVRLYLSAREKHSSSSDVSDTSIGYCLVTMLSSHSDFYFLLIRGCMFKIATKPSLQICIFTMERKEIQKEKPMKMTIVSFVLPCFLI